MESTHQDTAEVLQLPKDYSSIINETTTGKKYFKESEASLDISNECLIPSTDEGSSLINKTKNGEVSHTDHETIGLKEPNESLVPSVDGGDTNLSEERKPQRNEAVDPIIEEKQERIDDLLDHFTRFVQKRNFKNYQYVIDLQDKLIKSYEDQLKALIDMPDLSSEEPTSVNSNTAINAKRIWRAQLKKNKICIHFFKKGVCAKEKCKYSHVGKLEVGMKRGRCFDLIQYGACSKGQECAYSHDFTNLTENEINKIRRNAVRYNKGKKRKLEEN